MSPCTLSSELWNLGTSLTYFLLVKRASLQNTYFKNSEEQPWLCDLGGFLNTGNSRWFIFLSQKWSVGRRMIPNGSGRSVWEVEPSLYGTLCSVLGDAKPCGLSAYLQGRAGSPTCSACPQVVGRTMFSTEKVWGVRC